MAPHRLTLVTIAACIAACVGAGATGCKAEEARPPVTNDPTAPGGNGGTSQDGGGSADGGGGVFASFGAAARHLAIDSTAVYVTLSPTVDLDAGGGDGGMNGSIVAVPRSGASPVTIETGGAPDDVLVVADTLMWSDSSGAPGQSAVYRASLTGPAGSGATLVASGLQGPITLASDGTNVYFASNLVGSSGVTVDRAAIAGGLVTNVTVIAGELTAGALVTDGTGVYFAANGLAGGEVLHVPAGGGAADVVWSSPAVHAADVAFSAGILYLAVGAPGANGGLVAVQTTAPATTTILSSGDFIPTALALDGTSAYVTAVSAGAGVLARFPLAGGDPVTLANGTDTPVDLVVADAAYVAVDTLLQRIAK